MFSFIHVLYLTLFYVNIYCIAMYTVAILCMLCLCLMGLWPSGYYWINLCAWSITEAGVFFRSSGMFVIRLGRFVFVRLLCSVSLQFTPSSTTAARPVEIERSSLISWSNGWWVLIDAAFGKKSCCCVKCQYLYVAPRCFDICSLKWSLHRELPPLVHDEDPLVTDALGHSSTLRERSPDGF